MRADKWRIEGKVDHISQSEKAVTTATKSNKQMLTWIIVHVELHSFQALGFGRNYNIAFKMHK